MLKQKEHAVVLIHVLAKHQPTLTRAIRKRQLKREIMSDKEAFDAATLIYKNTVSITWLTSNAEKKEEE
jgi:hypothetical protein